jgi:hypothetical protein
MDYISLICSISFFICSFAFYKIHKLWQKDAAENDKLYKFQIQAGNFKHWLMIIMLLMCGIVYLFKALP